MYYKIVKMGLGSFQVDLPIESQYGLHVVGVIDIKGRMLVTHISLDEMATLTKTLKKTTLLIKHVYDIPTDRSIDSYFILNGVQHREHVNGQPACWIAWFDSNPEHIFIVPHNFCKDPHFERQEERYGIFDISAGEAVLKTVCNATTSIYTLTETL